MEKNRDDLVVILAGYADKMDLFFSVESRACRAGSLTTSPSPITRSSELEQIAMLMIDGLGYSFSPDARDCVALATWTGGSDSRGSPTRAVCATRWKGRGYAMRGDC